MKGMKQGKIENQKSHKIEKVFDTDFFVRAISCASFSYNVLSLLEFFVMQNHIALQQI